MKLYLRGVLYGLLVWIVPFVTGFLFYTPEGELKGNIFLFKSVMIVVSALIGAILLVSYFRRIKENYVREGIVLGCVWLVLNLLLDFLILIPMADMSHIDYFMEIGLRYLVMPIFSVAIGVSLARKN